MKRPEITKQLSELLEKHIDPHNDPRVYWAKEVTFDYATSNTVRVDYMLFKPINNSVSGIEKGDFSCYEIKSSVDDFHSKNGHNFIGDKNYYVMPESVFENEPVHCKDCQHLMFSDCYGECTKCHLGIVRPDDSCEFGERRATTHV